MAIGHLQLRSCWLASHCKLMQCSRQLGGSRRDSLTYQMSLIMCHKPQCSLVAQTLHSLCQQHWELRGMALDYILVACTHKLLQKAAHWTFHPQTHRLSTPFRGGRQSRLPAVTCSALAQLQGSCNRRLHTGLMRHRSCSRQQTTTYRAAGVALSGSPGAPRCPEPAAERHSALHIRPVMLPSH